MVGACNEEMQGGGTALSLTRAYFIKGTRASQSNSLEFPKGCTVHTEYPYQVRSNCVGLTRGVIAHMRDHFHPQPYLFEY